MVSGSLWVLQRDHECFVLIVNGTGSSTIRAGWAFDAGPRYSLPPLMARYKDRKINRYLTFIGSDVFADGTARGQAKNMYDPGSNIVNNWDVTEGVLDYIFVKLGATDTDGGIERPVVMTEAVANLAYARKSKDGGDNVSLSPANIYQQ